MTLVGLFLCFILSAVVWVPLAYWIRGAMARAAKPEIVRQIRADIGKCDVICGDVTLVPFEGHVNS